MAYVTTSSGSSGLGLTQEEVPGTLAAGAAASMRLGPVEAARYNAMAMLVLAMYAAREEAAKKMAPAINAIKNGYTGNVADLAAGKTALEMVGSGIPTGGWPTPQSPPVPGFSRSGAAILGVQSPKDAPSTPAGYIFRTAQADLDWWINAGGEALNTLRIASASGPDPDVLGVWVAKLSEMSQSIVDAAGSASKGAAATLDMMKKAAEKANKIVGTDFGTVAIVAAGIGLIAMLFSGKK
jgi:hypothetical protein